jgi:hypothetical protein
LACHRQAGAKLAQGLSVIGAQPVEQFPPAGIRQGLEDQIVI